MVALSVPEQVSRPLLSLSRSPLFLAIALHAVVLLIPLTLWGRSNSLLSPEDQVSLIELPPVDESSATGGSFAPMDGSTPPPPLDSGGFTASDGGFTPPADSGGFTPSDGGGFTPSDDGGFVPPTDGGGGFTASDDGGFVPPAADPAPAREPVPPSSPSATGQGGGDQADSIAAAPSPPTEAISPAPSESSAPRTPSVNPDSSPGSPTPLAAGTSTTASATFPRYAGATPVIFARSLLYDNVSSYQSAAPLGQVRQWYTQTLTAQNYQVRTVEDESGRVVLELTKDGKTQYLHLFANGPATGTNTAGTNIVLSSDRLQGDLRNLPVEPSTVSRFFTGLRIPQPGQMLDQAGAIVLQDVGESGDAETLYWQNLTADQLAQPELFYRNSPSPGTAAEPLWVEGIRRAVIRFGQTPAGVINELKPSLMQQGYQITPVASGYRGTPLYAINKDGITAYLSLVLTRDQSSTAVVIWNRSPL